LLNGLEMAKAIVHPWGVVITRDEIDDEEELEEHDYEQVLCEVMEKQEQLKNKMWLDTFNEIMETN